MSRRPRPPPLDARPLRARALTKKLCTATDNVMQPIWPALRAQEMVAALKQHPVDAQELIAQHIKKLAHIGPLQAFDARQLVQAVATWAPDEGRRRCAALSSIRRLWAGTAALQWRTRCFMAAIQMANGWALDDLQPGVQVIGEVADAMRLSPIALPAFFADVGSVAARDRAALCRCLVALRRPAGGWDPGDHLFAGLRRLSEAERARLVALVEASTAPARPPPRHAAQYLAVLRETTALTLLGHQPRRWARVAAHLGRLNQQMAGEHIDALDFAVAKCRRWPLPAVERPIGA